MKRQGKTNHQPGGGGVRGRRSTAWLTNRGSLQRSQMRGVREKGESLMWAVKPTTTTTTQQPSLSSSTPREKSMPALLVFLPSLADALRRGEQTSGLLVRPQPAVCDAGWEPPPHVFLFRMECLLRTDRTDTAYSHLKSSTGDLNWTHPCCTPSSPLNSPPSVCRGCPVLRPALESAHGHKPAGLCCLSTRHELNVLSDQEYFVSKRG